MIRGIIRFSLRFRGVVIALACVLVGFGFYTALHAKLDVFPEFAPPQVVIQTEAPGLSTEEVEALVTRPVESGVNGVGDLESIRSQSIQGLSVVIVIFREGTDILRARQMVGERLVQVAGELPIGVRAPRMAPLTSTTSMVYVVGFTSMKRTPMELRTFVDGTVRRRLLGVPGVANVVEFGGEVREIQVQLRPERLAAYGLGVNDVLESARKSTGVVGAGFIETAAQRITLRTHGQQLTPEEIGLTVLAEHEGARVRLQDVARVVEGPEPRIGDSSVNGAPGVLLQVWSQFGTNTREVTAGVESALRELAPAIRSAEVDLTSPPLFRPATFIEKSIRNVNASLLLGGVLVAVVLTLFLFNLRTAFISLSAIPLSLLGAVIVLDRFGVTLNTLTLGGLAIAIGEVVDDAIIDVENIFRRLRENREKGSPRSTFRVVLDASIEVRAAVVYATFVVALVFLPVLTMSGVQGKLFAPLGIAYILATLASLVVALTVTPALSYLMLGRARHASEPRYIRWIKARHRGLLESTGRHPGFVITGAAVLCVAAAATLPFAGGEFLPEFREGNFIIQMSAAPGTSAPESIRIGNEVTRELRALKYVESVSQQTGRGELGEDTTGTEFSEFIVALKPLEGEEAELAQGEIRKAVAKFPGLVFGVKTFLKERIEETIAGTRAALAVRVYGEDLDVLDQKARELEHVLKSIPGADDVRFLSSEEPQLVVRLRQDRVRQFGMKPLDVLEAVQISYQGARVAQTFEGNRVFDVTVILEEAARRDPESVGGLLLGGAGKALVPLREVADVYQASGRHAVLHDGTRRYQEVSLNVRDRDLGSFVKEAKARVAAMPFPAGTYARFKGAAEAEAQTRADLLRWSLVAGVGILLLLSMVVRSVRNLFLVLANLPFALVGGAVAVFMTGGALSVGSLVGFVTLFGITTRNSIMMVSHFEHLVAVEGCEWGWETALRGASERLIPVLMTALVTALGLLPMAIGTGEPGREIEGPMAIVILGGLGTSTVLNLLVLPTLALRFGRFDKDAGPDGDEESLLPKAHGNP